MPRQCTNDTDCHAIIATKFSIIKVTWPRSYKLERIENLFRTLKLIDSKKLTFLGILMVKGFSMSETQF